MFLKIYMSWHRVKNKTRDTKLRWPNFGRIMIINFYYIFLDKFWIFDQKHVFFSQLSTESLNICNEIQRYKYQIMGYLN